MRSVPFFANTSDDTHCVQACFKIMLKYFLPERNFSWLELDKMTHKVPGKGTWWFPMLMEVEKLGLKTKYIENLDYKKLFHEGDSYVLDYYGAEAAQYVLEETNLTEVRQLIPDFLHTSKGEQRPATLKDIDKLLAAGWLVAIIINSRALNGLNGYFGHMIVVYDKSGSSYVTHDPGLPARPHRKVSAKILLRAWEHAGEQSKELVAIGKGL